MRTRQVATYVGLMALLLLCGCGGVIPAQMGPSGIGFRGSAFTQVTYPAANTAETRFQFDMDDVEIVGPVSGTSTSHSIIFGLIAIGDSGYKAALEEARRSGADDIVNMRVDATYFNFLGLYSKVDLIVHGTGIRWK